MSTQAIQVVDAISRSDILIADFCFWVGVVILLYDHVATLPTEIKTVWTRPKLPWLFMVHRYFASFGSIGVAYMLYIRAEEVCNAKKYIRQATLVILEVIVCVILLMRTRALYGGDRRITWFGWGSALALIGLSVYSLVGQGPDKTPPAEFGCHITQLSSASAAFLSIPWNGLLAFDIIIFGLTIRKTYQLEAKNAGATGTMMISGVMFRDGTMYFAAVAMSNLVNILVLHLAPRPFLRSSMISFASSVSVTLASRLMLNMFELSAKDLDWDKEDVTSIRGPEISHLHVAIHVLQDVELGLSEKDYDEKKELARPMSLHPNYRPSSFLPPPIVAVRRL